MRLVVEEAQDHSACMEKLRDLYGTDCVVVHSFRVDDRYRVVVALETEIRSRELPQTSIVKDVVSNRQIHWDTLIDDDMAGLDDLPSDQPDGNETGRHGTSPQALPDISSGLLELAARIKALEAFEPPAILEPESNDFRAAFFQTCWQPLLPRAQMHRKPPHIPVTVSPRQCGTHWKQRPPLLA